MTRSLAKIREQLTQLDAQTETQWHRLAQTYDHYAQRLSQTLQQQAVYAVYQICTQIYPAAFLQLSVSNRQKFQQ
jgi:molecular chaperone GrpE (heat shock protein)